MYVWGMFYHLNANTVKYLLTFIIGFICLGAVAQRVPKVLHTLDGGNGIFTLDDKKILTANDAGLRYYDLNGEKIAFAKHSDMIITSSSFTADGKYLAVEALENGVFLKDATLKDIDHFMGTGYSFSRDGNKLASADDTSYFIYDRLQKKRNWFKSKHIQEYQAIYHPTQDLILIGTTDNIGIFDLRGNLIKKLNIFEEKLQEYSIEVKSFDVSSDGKYLLVHNENKFSLFTLEGAKLFTVTFPVGRGFENKFNSVAFTRDAKKIIATSNHVVYLYDLEGHKLDQFSLLLGQDASFYMAMLSNDGTLLLACTDERTLLCQVPTGQPKKTQSGAKKVR